MSVAKRVLRALLPPVVTNTLRTARHRRRRREEFSEWQYVGSRWPATSGWNDPSVTETQRREWPAFLRSIESPNPLGGPTGSDLDSQTLFLAFGYVVGLAAQGRNRISMLDWGCGVGQYAKLARSLFPRLDLEYHGHELPSLAGLARELTDRDAFYDQPEAALGRTYDLVMASGSLQYSEDWGEVLSRLAAASSRYLYVTRLPIIEEADSYVAVQRPIWRGYATEYPGWFLSRRQFLGKTDSLGLKLVRELLTSGRATVPGGPEPASYRGFLFASSAEPDDRQDGSPSSRSSVVRPKHNGSST